MFDSVYTVIDPLLIFFFRLAAVPIVGYLIGIAVLSLLCVLLGQVTLFISFCVNLQAIRSQNQEMVKMQNLSVYALLSKNKRAFKACNKQANDAFGRVFFTQIALAASSLWPVAFALGWLDFRFGGVDFLLPLALPLIGDSVGYAFTFIPMFILVHILYTRVQKKLPFFGFIERKIAAAREGTDALVSFSDVAVPAEGASPRGQQV